MGFKAACFGSVLGLLFPAAASFAESATGPDFERERRMAAEIGDAILDGEALQLKTADGQQFLGIYAASTSDEPAKGTLVILHGRGFHPDWVDVVQPLRVDLTAFGWNTLAIQLPVLHKQAKYYDYVSIFPAAGPRIESAVAEARALSDGRVVVLAHSCGAHMAQHWFNANGADAVRLIDGFIGIGMGATDYGQAMSEPFALDKIDVPVLDLFGAADFPAVLRMAPERLRAMSTAGNVKNRQIRIPAAGHYFVGHNDALIEAVSGWLNTL